MKLSDVRALVTGGSSGIGFEIARQLKERGAEVVICGRDEAKVIEAAKKIGAHGIRADVSVEADVVALIRKTVELYPDYNVLVNNAGFGSFAPLLDTDLAGMQRLSRQTGRPFFYEINGEKLGFGPPLFQQDMLERARRGEPMW